MLEQIMFWAILGHFIGDYLCQPRKMALRKSELGIDGALICVLHCLIYTAVVWILVPVGLGHWPTRGELLIIPMIFLTHYPIDRWSLAGKWLRLIGGRTLHGEIASAEVRAWNYSYAENVASLSTSQAFAATVYTVVDNTMHIILMTAGFAALLRWGVI